MSHNFRVPLSSTVRCHKLHTGAHGSLGFRVFHGQHGLLQSLNVLGPNKPYLCRIRNLARRLRMPQQHNVWHQFAASRYGSQVVALRISARMITGLINIGVKRIRHRCKKPACWLICLGLFLSSCLKGMLTGS